MLDTVQIRRRGAQDFEAYYDNACAMQDSVPLPAVKANLSQGMLDFNGDRLKLTDWTPILNTLTINKQLQHVAVRSCYQIGLSIGEPDKYRSANRKKIPAIRSKEMTFKLCKALRECLTASPNLKTLQLHGLPFRERDLITLTKGLAKSVSLENLSLAHCPIADEGLEAICQSVKYSPSIKTVDFTGCNLTWRGAEHMANIIKHQAMRRHSAAWAESLRYRRPEFEGMGGLRRVTLNCNTLVGDRGAAALSQELAEDLWVKAVDLQKCGLSNDGTRSLLEALKSNTTLCVLDIRRNPLVDNDLVKSVIKRVLMNANGQSSQYSWIKPPALKDSQKPPSLKRRILGNTARGKATFRIGPRRLSSASRRSPVVAQQPHPSLSRCIPWRTAERAGRQRGLPPGNTVAEQSFEGAATVKVTMETESEEEGEEEAVETKSPSALSLHERITVRQYRRVQVELEECRLRLAEERRARVKADTCLMEYELENARLRSINFSLSEALHAPATGPSCVLEDDAVLDSIESSFSKFHAFLDLLKDAGLGQLASMAGIDQSDFGPLGRPQLSSTVGRPLVGSGDQDTREKGGDSSSAPSEGQPNGCTPGAPATLRGFSPEGDLQEVPPVPASEFASEPCVEKPGGENQQRVPSPSQPEGRLVSGSEHSIHSNGSHGNDSYAEGSHSNDSQGSGSYGKGSRGRNVSHHSNGNGSKHSNGSNHSHGSHGYSFNYSNCSHAYSSIHSDGFHSNGWHVDGSVRSSLSDRSDRVESVGSFGLKASGGGRVGSGAQK
ncbi:centrosomal protein of 78 kDa isoform X3 [Coregonus clupeaformis]|uniref:centrosomal protein of 78 kDa isoform X3 n=1 Tax=Coregonus clupeaformis TaxID=59861 RepID=UPI001E1C7390|nr:centrosomal protein of 78 kDa isoform X3 [Coregonus clupeaformis]